MPDEKSHGGYTTIFQNMLQHQVKIATVQSRLDREPPKVSLKARDQMNHRKTRVEPNLDFVEKTFRTVEQLNQRSMHLVFCLEAIVLV